jgi:hypothetical protein
MRPSNNHSQIPAADTRAEAAPRPSTLEVRLPGPFRVLVDNQLIEELIFLASF